MHRFENKTLKLASFADEIFVECPKCQKRATVGYAKPGNPRSDRCVRCPNCMHTQMGRKESYVVEVNCHCANCGSPIHKSIQYTNEPREQIAVTCNACGKTEKYTARNTRIEWIHEYVGRPTEPYFQLPLWLVVSVRGHNLWAYNHEHLSYLKAYVSADLRERSGSTFSGMVEKLPDWMKSAKNREAVIKGIERLEKM